MAVLLGPVSIEGWQRVCAATHLALVFSLCELQNVAQPQRGCVEYNSVLESLIQRLTGKCTARASHVVPAYRN